ncbi:GNAT family N-acetyltransferase [Heyndrickxia sp. MSNUG]|uniref:GNAT family N-acetyltransferase n=1 Tax=Heyndrickxia sp. MSNUG TaxID=3136677 RepID=UPI003C2F1319
MDIEIRGYEDKDYMELCGMVNSLYSEDTEGQPMNTSKLAATMNEYKKNPEKIRIVILEKNNAIIGYSIFVYLWSNEYGGNILIVDELYIKEKVRNEGIGSYFIKWLEESEEFVAIQLETTPSNKRVFNYYIRLGFKVVENAHLIKIRH